MFYERTETGWKTNNAKSVFFNKSTHPIESLPAEFWNDNRKKAADRPEYDTATEKLVGPQEIGGGFVGYVVEDLTPEEIEAKRIAAVHSTIDRISIAAKDYVEHELNAAGMFEVRDMIAATNNAKALETEAWVRSVYGEAEVRKALVTAELWDDGLDVTDFTMFGEKPYTIAQLMAEA